ncbi:hypothetical protein LRP88_07334 [Fusarium phalaenopsidis]|nr:Peptidase C45 acyl-coenzyme A:6-aminopenicillanic acid acyl-transferase [Fusarium sp. Ph1]
MFLVTEAGQLGRSGMNSFGMSVTANSLMSTDDYSPEGNIEKPVMPISLLRRMVLESAHLSEALTAVQQIPRHVNNNLTIASSQGFGMCLEITPNQVYRLHYNLDEQYLVHANHFVNNAALSRDSVYDRYPGGSSWFRRQRFEQCIRPFAHGLKHYVVTQKRTQLM